MRKNILPLLFFVLSSLVVKNSFSQQIASGTYAIPGTVTLTTSATISITTIGTAIDALNAYGVQSGGTVQFNFADGYTETATGTNGTGIGLYTIGGTGSALFSTSYNAVIFKHNGTGVNPKLMATTLGQNSASDYILRILGADNITFDGIDFVENPANTITPSVTASTTVAPMEYGVQILNSGADGAQNNTIKNDTITLYNFLSSTSTQSSSNTYGIYQLSTTAGGKNSGNVYDHVFITRAYRGIVINGMAGSEDVGCVISNCKVGGSNAGDIGGASTTYGGAVDAMGVRIISQQDFTFYNDTVQDVQFARTGSSGIAYGVFFSLTTGTTTFNNNKIFNIINKRTGSASGSPCVGLEVEANSGSITNVYNNFIGSIISSAATTSTFMLFGIRIQSAGTINVYHNSIQLPNISGSGLCSSAALCTSDGSTGSGTFAGTVNVEDNILANNSNITSGSAKAYSFYFGGGTLGISNYNNFDIIPSGSKTYTGNYLGTTKQTLASWQASAGDANSQQFTTAFASVNDLHLTIAAPNALYNGIFIVNPPASVTITTDIDNETRVYPIIGADEPLFTTTQVRISNNNPGDSIVSKGTTNQPLAGVVLTALGTSNTLSSITFTTGGTYSITSFTNIRLVYNTTNTIVGATTLSTSPSTPTSGGTLSFTGLTQALPLGANYLFVIFDIPTGANAGDNIRVTSTPFTSIGLASGTTKVGTNPVPQGGLQTVAQFYFNYPNSDITLTTSWYETVSGSFNPPPDFVSNNQVFNFIANTGATEGLASGNTSWTVDGTNSKIIVGDGINPVTFQAKFPVYTNSLVAMDIKNNGVVQFQSSYIPTRLGVLDQGTAVTPGSTVEYGDTAVTPTADTIIVANYCNLTLSGFATGTRRFAPVSTIGVSRVFTPGGFTAAVNGKINFNGALVAQVIPTGFLFNNLTVNNTTVTPTTMAGNVSVDSVLKVSSNLTIGSGQTMNLTVNATATLADTLLVNGSLTVNNPIPTEFTGATTLNLQFGANSNYNISANLSGANGGQIPAATWASNSTINITNVTNPTANISVSAPSGVGFGNINFDAPSLSVTDTLFGGFKYVGSGGSGNPFVVTLQGNLTLGRTGAGPQTVQFKPSGKSMNVNVGGNVSQYAGTYQLSNSSTDTANFVIAGKDSINGAYVYSPATGYSSPVFIISSVGYGRLKVGGNFIMKNTSALSETGGKAFVFFTGASAQTCIFTNVTASSATDSISMTVPGAGGVLLNSDLLVSPGVLNLTLTTGNFSIGANTLTVNGVIGTGAGTFTGSTNSNLTLSGTTAKYASVGTLYFTSGSRLLNNLTLNRTLSTLASPSAALGTDLQVNGACALTSGVFKINGNTLTLNGTYTSGLANVGSLTGSATSNLVVGSSATSIPLTFTYDASKVNNSLYSLTASANTSLANSTTSSSLYIVGGSSLAPGNVTVNGNAIFTTHDSLTLQSNASGTARVGANTTSSTYINGNVTIERYIQPLRSWRLLTAPISSNETINASWQEGDITTIATSPNSTTPNIVTGFGTQITNVLATSPAATGFDKAVTNNPSILYLNSTGHTTTWAVPLNTNTIFVNSQPGFMLFVRGDRTVQVKTSPFPAANATVLRTKGTLKEGQITVTPPATASPAGAWGVVGNPYASETLLNGIFGSYLSSVGGAYYAYDPTLAGAAGVGAFATFVYNSPNNYSQTSTPSSSNLVAGKIESGQAFLFNFVATPNAFIKEADKGDSAILVFRPVSDDVSSFRADLYDVNTADNSTDLEDGTLTLYDSQYSDSVNWLEDAKKLSNPGENLALERGGQLLAIEKRQPITVTDTIFLSVTNMQIKTHQFQFAAAGLVQPDLIARLEDSFLGISTPVSLTDTTKINFDITSNPASQGGNRFRVIFQTVDAGPLPVTFTSVKASQQTLSSNNIVVQWNVTNQLNIKQYEVEKSTDGLNFSQVNTTSATLSNQSIIGYNWTDDKAIDGDNYYRIVSVNNNGTLSYSQIVKVKLGGNISQISIYPNPVRNGELGLQLTNMPQGKYGLRLLSAAGQEIITTQIVHGGGSSSQQVKLPASLSKGIYQLEILKPDNNTSIINVLLN